jgi:hypothetical protein
MKMAVFWVVAPYSPVGVYRLQEMLTAFTIGTMRKHIFNFGQFPADNMTQYVRTHSSSYS